MRQWSLWSHAGWLYLYSDRQAPDDVRRQRHHDLTYDSRDRLQSKQTPFGTLTYSYDNAGNLVGMSSSNTNGAMTSYSYDKLNRLQTVTDNAALLAGAANALTTYGYDPAGNLASAFSDLRMINSRA